MYSNPTGWTEKEIAAPITWSVLLWWICFQPMRDAAIARNVNLMEQT